MSFPFRTFAAGLAAAAAIVLAACEPSADRAAESAVDRLRPEEVASASPDAGAGALAGAFRVDYAAVESPVYAAWRAGFRDTRFLEEIAAGLNAWIALPADVTLALAECGEANAFYQPEERAVVLCYELVDDLERMFEGDPAPDQAVEDALLFTTLHEVGHALVDVLDLPVTGKEEDAVDQLAALMLADGSDQGDQAALNGVAGLGDQQVIDDLAFADEHALVAQRFYNVACLVYGQDPDAYAHWVDQGVLPAERAEGCADEYAQVASSWDRLLAGYLRS